MEEDRSAARPPTVVATSFGAGLPDAPVAGWTTTPYGDAAMVAAHAEPVPAYPPYTVEELLEIQYGARPRGYRSSHPNPYNLSEACQEDLAELLDQFQHERGGAASRNVRSLQQVTLIFYRSRTAAPWRSPCAPGTS